MSRKPDVIWLTAMIVIIIMLAIAYTSTAIQTSLNGGEIEGIGYSSFTSLITANSSVTSTITASERSFVDYGEGETVLIFISIILTFIALFKKRVIIISGISSILSAILGFMALSDFNSLLSGATASTGSVLSSAGTGLYLVLLAGLLAIWSYVIISKYDVSIKEKQKVDKPNAETHKEDNKPSEQSENDQSNKTDNEQNTSPADSISKSIENGVNKEMSDKRKAEDDKAVTLK